MANKFTRFLKGVGEGLLAPKGGLANWRHATRLFIDDTYRLAPRTNFMFYVQFELDKSAIKAPQFVNQHADEVGYLVKSASLPKYNMDSVIKNQYNRKKIVYKKIDYQSVDIAFHDDTRGIINALWAIYYGYYVADRALPDAAYSATHYRSSEDFRSNFRYGLDNNKTTDIFKSISLYTMSQRRFNGYTLVNPRIKSWQHGELDYSGSEFLGHSMTLDYEAVRYTTGNVSINNPKGFASLHYDTVPSPLTVAGGGSATLLGEGGVLAGISEIFGAVGDGTAFDSPGNFLSTAIKAANTIRNAKNLDARSITREAVGILSNPSSVRNIVNTVGGLVGSNLPKNTSTNTNTVVASAKKLTR